MRNRLRKLHRDKDKTNGLIKITEHKLEKIAEIHDKKYQWSNQLELQKVKDFESVELRRVRLRMEREEREDAIKQSKLQSRNRAKEIHDRVLHSQEVYL